MSRRTLWDDAADEAKSAWLLVLAIVGLLAVAVFGALVIGCVTPAPPPPNPPGPAPALTCARACENVLEQLGCDASGCVDICRRVGDQRFTDCIGTAPTCGDVDRCDTK